MKRYQAWRITRSWQKGHKKSENNSTISEHLQSKLSKTHVFCLNGVYWYVSLNFNVLVVKIHWRAWEKNILVQGFSAPSLESDNVKVSVITCFSIKMFRRRKSWLEYQHHYHPISNTLYWCLYRHLCILPERFGKKDLWIANLISVNR